MNYHGKWYQFRIYRDLGRWRFGLTVDLISFNVGWGVALTKYGWFSLNLSWISLDFARLITIDVETLKLNEFDQEFDWKTYPPQ